MNHQKSCNPYCGLGGHRCGVSVDDRLSAFGDGLAINSDTAIGTNGSAEGAAGAIMQGVEQYDRAVAFAVEIIGQGDDIGRAGFAAKFTAFATLDINYNSTFCHCGKLLFMVAGDGLQLACVVYSPFFYPLPATNTTVHSEKQIVI
jgi:hypothetical protein